MFGRNKKPPTQAESRVALEDSLHLAVTTARKSGLTPTVIANLVRGVAEFIQRKIDQEIERRQYGSANTIAVNEQWAENEKARLERVARIKAERGV